MIRIVIENLFFFLLPTLIYVAWMAFKHNEWPGLWTVLRRAPLVLLFILGAALMLLTLAVLSTRSGNSPDSVYVPPSVRDGVVMPGHRATPKKPSEASPAPSSSPSLQDTGTAPAPTTTPSADRKPNPLAAPGR